MKIEQSSLSMQGAAQRQSMARSETSMQFSLRAPRQEAPPPAERVDISAAGRDALGATSEVDTSEGSNSPADERLSLLIAVIERLTGRKVEFFDSSDLENVAQAGQPPSDVPANPQGRAAAPEPEWSFHFEHREMHETVEAMQYSARGTVTTADGREISFDIALEVSRYERQSSETVIDAGNVRKDPLVLNLAGGPALLDGQRIQFDLDSDGKKEAIATLGGGSAFLAIDRNGNGVIDDGSELFGPRTGSGFSELADLDSDHNGWIDSSDLQFSQLQVWRPGGTLQSLGTANVGAIALQSAETPFSLHEGADDRGVIRRTGVYLNEDGTAGTIQHIDLTV
ncbi:MAG: hypothetical protein QM776_18545 [Rhodocyclaceae bacterium]